jgi:hypothetical protein
MRSASPHRKIVLVAALLLLMAAPGASAGPRYESGHPARISDFLSYAWSLLTGFWTKEGCHIDPSGSYCSPQTVLTPSADIGCNIDPDGRCLPASAPLPTKEGCHIDPDGRCLATWHQVVSPSNATDVGCNIDPNGGRCGS